MPDDEHEPDDDEPISDGSSDEFLRAVARSPSVRIAQRGSQDALLGTTMGRYRLQELIGQGGMGVVYRAVDERLRRDVAIKVLPTDLLDDRDRRRRFLREARLTAAITHPNIAMVHDVGEQGDHVFIAMELVRGRTLRAVLTDGGPLAARDAIRIAVGVARGLAKAHEARIVHRDIKPDNVIVSDEHVVKILDFGLAKAYGDPDKPAESGIATEPGRALGTPAYMSPEQAKARMVNGRSDVFSFGVMLYELVTATKPFGGARSLAEILLAHQMAVVVPVRRVRPDLPRAFASVVNACLKTDIADRPSIATVLAALERGKSLEGRSVPTFIVAGAVVLAIGALLAGVLLALRSH
jgi:eukaryotic-like serine/threonine-protein kinase